MFVFLLYFFLFSFLNIYKIYTIYTIHIPYIPYMCHKYHIYHIYMCKYTHQYIYQYICQCYRLKGGAAFGRPPTKGGRGLRPRPPFVGILLVYSIGICIGICIGVYICIYVYEHGYAHHSMGEEFSPHAMVAGSLNSRLVLYNMF